MKRYVAMVEVLGEGGELQPLLWNPNHLVDGRAILIVDEVEGKIWVWLGEGTTIVQRTTALRQSRFIMVNGFRVNNILIGTKCTEFIEISKGMDEPIAKPLQKLLKAHSKAPEYLVVVKDEESVPTFDKAFQKRVEAISHTIAPEPLRQKPVVRRRMLSYEEQLASKVLFAVSDCYGHAIIKPLGPKQFEVSTSRLNVRFHCEGDAILFSLILAASQDDVDSFASCFGQTPQFDATGQQIIDSSLAGVTVTKRPKEQEEKQGEKQDKPISLTERMRRQLSELGKSIENKSTESEESSSEEKDELESREDESYF